MKKEKTKILILIFIFSFFFGMAEASLKIVEVMYDPLGGDENREWVKLYNSGDEDINIIGGKGSGSWRFVDKASHYINDSITVSPHDYAVLASDKNTFLDEYSSFSGPVADTTMSLPNTPGTVSISDGSNIIDSFDYPSSSNINSTDNNEDQEVGSSVDNDSASSIDKSEEEDLLKIITKINFPKTITAQVPFSFYSTTFDNRKIKHNVGKFVWNFGDGVSITTDTYGPFTYTYEYPGDYIVNLYYFDNNFITIPDAVDKINVKVISSGIYISSVGDKNHPYVEIKNSSKFDVDLSGWIISTTSKSFIFPNGSSILKGSTLKINPNATNFTEDDLKYLIIQNSRGDIMSTYPSKIIKTNSSSNSKKQINNNINEDVIDLNKLPASVGNSDINIGENQYLFLIVIIIIGTISFLLVKRKKDKFREIEEEVSADNFKILE